MTAAYQQGLFQLIGNDKKWTEFPGDTHISWRGPMILWNHSHSGYNKPSCVYYSKYIFVNT